MSRIALEPAYVLHSRPFRETSLLVEVFTRSLGRQGLIARGARGAKSTRKAALQPFRPLLLSWVGRGELGTLTGADQVAADWTRALARHQKTQQPAARRTEHQPGLGRRRRERFVPFGNILQLDGNGGRIDRARERITVLCIADDDEILNGLVLPNEGLVAADMDRHQR